MAHQGQAVHVPCAFSLVEVLSTLYAEFLKFDPKDSKSTDRDILALSKGHGVMALYACFREIGWLTQTDLDQYFKDGSLLRGLSESNIPGLEVTSGSLGHGLPVATGIALGFKRHQELAKRVWCIVGDGELNEGSMWEAAMFASHHKLSNLFIIVDANQFQAMGRTETILNMESLTAKFQSFGFIAAECDGHNPAVLKKTIQELIGSGTEKPKALVARTIKGKGISFMENDNSWHYTRVDDATLARALKELE